MKYAVISDIHGNMEALDAVLKDIETTEQADKILCLGDLAMAGPEPAAAVDRVMDLVKAGKVVCIQGNTDKMIADFNDDILKSLQSKNEIMANALQADVKALNDEQKDFLKNLPVNHEFSYLNTKILMVHGSPRKNDENIFPEMPMSEIEEMVKDTDADIILCGHTHVPCGYQTESRKTIVNDGSVGRPFSEEPKACYAVLDIGMGCVSVRHKHIAYDVDTASKKLLSRGFDGSDKLAKMLIHATSRYPQ